MAASQQTSMTLAGPLSGDGLRSLLLAAAERNMYASVIIEGSSANGMIHLVDGQIALLGSDDLQAMRIAQHELTSLLRASIGAATGTFRCAPLTNIEHAHALRSVGVQQVLTAVGAISATETVDELAPRRTPAVDPAILVSATASQTAEPVADLRAVETPELVGAAVAPEAQDNRPVRASQLRKMLRLKGSAKRPVDSSTVEKILVEPDNAVDRQAALRSIIRDLAA